MLQLGSRASLAVLLSPVIAAASLIAGCAGPDAAGPTAAASMGTTQTFSLSLPQQDSSPDTGGAMALPLYHLGPVDLAEPEDRDRLDRKGSAAFGPHRQSVTRQMSQLSTRRLTKSAMDSMERTGSAPSMSMALSADATPMATGAVVATYTPAQIRAAYALPALPAVGSSLTSAQAAQLGAGQTIYIVDAQHDPNVAAELSTFSTKFGLPACTATTLTPATSLPLAAAPTGSCSLVVAYASATGVLTATPPAFDAGWATEIALDVQWAHATAPLARIVLIEAPDASLNSLLAAVRLANGMGPGIVSMSFGAAEGNWTASVDTAFAGTGMSYFAAAGDSGAAVNWPAVSTRVVAVGGSSLSWSGTSPRREVVWNLSGGARSLYVAAPAWQSGAVPGMLTTGSRAVSDVAFNADPATGQYVVTIAPGSTTPGWVSAGGTSLAAPQWAGIAAIANATRALAGQARLGAPHTQLYALAAQATTYARAFADITSGSNGSCGTCSAGTGYDLPTGLGTPNVTDLLGSLAGPAPAAAPVVLAGNVSGTSGTPLSFPVTVTAANAVSLSLLSAPAGVTVSTAGVVSWAAPTTGTYSVVVYARDTVNGLTGQGSYTVSIAAPLPPVVTAATLSATAGTAFNYAVQVVAPNAVTYTLGAAPTGLAVSTAGVLTWTSPVAGSYPFSVVARDTRTGLTGQASFTLTVAPPRPPVIAAATVSGIAGRALTYSVSATAANPLTFSLSGAPAGLAIDANGLLSWSAPVAGKYSVTVTVKDRVTGLSASAVLSLTIVPAGPVLSATTLSGAVGRLLTGSISFSDATSTSLSFTISGVPSGMSLGLSGSAISISWTPPVAGTWSLSVSARDGNGLTSTLVVPVTVK